MSTVDTMLNIFVKPRNIHKASVKIDCCIMLSIVSFTHFSMTFHDSYSCRKLRVPIS